MGVCIIQVKLRLAGTCSQELVQSFTAHVPLLEITEKTLDFSSTALSTLSRYLVS